MQILAGKAVRSRLPGLAHPHQTGALIPSAGLGIPQIIIDAVPVASVDTVQGSPEKEVDGEMYELRNHAQGVGRYGERSAQVKLYHTS